MAEYLALIHKEPHSAYGVSFPDLPGCVTAARSLTEAMQRASEALALHVAGMAEDGLPLPAPSDLDTVMADPENRGAVAFLVPLPAAARAKVVRVNLTFPADELAAIDGFAQGHGYTRSGFLLRAARAAMGRAA